MKNHTPEQWVPIVELPPNPKIPDHYGHISECCGSVLLPPWEYEHALKCVAACTGMGSDPSTEIARLRDLATNWYTVDGLVKLTEEEVIERRKNAAAEIDALRKEVASYEEENFKLRSALETNRLIVKNIADKLETLYEDPTTPGATS